jgi:hypothetical protein
MQYLHPLMANNRLVEVTYELSDSADDEYQDGLVLRDCVEHV